MKGRIYLVLFTFLFFVSKAESSWDSCALSVFKDSEWPACIQSIDKGMANYEAEIIRNIQAAVVIKIADAIFTEGFKGTIVGKAVYGSEWEQQEALKKAVEEIIKEIKESEGRILDALYDSFESREYATLDFLFEQVQVYKARSPDINMANQYRVELNDMINGLAQTSDKFLIHQYFDLKTFIKIKLVEMSLRADRVAMDYLDQDNPEGIASAIKTEYSITLGNMLAELENEWPQIYNNGMQYFNGDYPKAFQRLSRSYQEWCGDENTTGMRQGYEYNLSIGSALANIVTDCDPFQYNSSESKSCLTSVNISNDTNGNLQRLLHNSIIKSAEEMPISSSWYWGSASNRAKVAGIENISQHYDRDLTLWKKYGLNKESRCILNEHDVVDGQSLVTNFNKVFFSDTIARMHGESIAYEFSATKQHIENPSLVYFNKLVPFEEMSGLPFTSSFPTELFAVYWRDGDSDGLKYYEEVEAGTSDFTADTDGDFIPDTIELKCGTDPRSVNSYDFVSFMSSCGMTVLDEVKIPSTGEGVIPLIDSIQPGQSIAIPIDHTCAREDHIGFDDPSLYVDGNEEIRNAITLYWGGSRSYRVKDDGYIEYRSARSVDNIVITNSSAYPATINARYKYECTD